MLMDKEKTSLLTYLAEASKNEQDIPSIAELSQILGVSIASVREQLEVARQLGFVDVKPRKGIQRRPFSLVPLISLGMNYGIYSEAHLLSDYIELRKHLELSYWNDAFDVLKDDQMDYMQFLIDIALRKLQRKPAIIPTEEQSEFHLTLFRPLGNKVLISILEAAWALEENNGGKILADLDDMLSSWRTRQIIVDALREKDKTKGKNALESLLALANKPKEADITRRFE